MKFASSNQQENPQCVVLLIINCYGIFSKLFLWSKMKFDLIMAVMLKQYSTEKVPVFRGA